MAEAVLDAMGGMLVRWTMGSAAAAAAPMWKAELGTDPVEAELRLLAFAAQFLDVAVTAEPPADLRMLSDVPVLALPTVPEPVRPLLRRLLKARDNSELLRFVAGRGWTVHPADWMPNVNDQKTPDVYEPWRDWAALATSTAEIKVEAGEQLSAENWGYWQPSALQSMLTRLRDRDPATARALLEAKLAGEKADARWRLLGVLAIRLSEADIPFLEGIAASDRAPNVKALASSLLSRMSQKTEVRPDYVAEIKEYFSVEVKGLVWRSRMIKSLPLKSNAHADWRTRLLDLVDVETFAGTLGLTGPELLKAWDWQPNPYNLQVPFVRMIARSGTDALVSQAVEAVVKYLDGQHPAVLVELVPRLSSDRRKALAISLLRSPGSHFVSARVIAGGAAWLEDPIGTPSGAALLAAVESGNGEPGDNAGEFNALGQITHRAWARRVLDRLNAAGIVQGDPRLDMLRLNEALEDRGETT